MRVTISRRPVKLRVYWSLLALPLICPGALLIPLSVAVLGVLQNEVWVGIFFGVIAIASFAALDRSIRGAANENVGRVESALEALRAASRGDQPIALLLRSFAQVHGYSDSAARFSLFELIAPALEATGFRPCAIGTALPLPPRHGVALIESTEADWWRHFEVLAAGAAVIVIIPEASTSLIREVDALRVRDFLAKTILIMPPRSISIVAGHEFPVVQAGGGDMLREEGWSTARVIWKKRFGVALPEYDQRGALIELYGSGVVADVTNLRQGDVDESFGPSSRRSEEEGRYRDDYGVPFDRLWAEILARRQFSGPPVREVWRRLRPTTPTIGLASYWRPPGDKGRLRHNVSLATFGGWGTLFLVAASALFGLVGMFSVLVAGIAVALLPGVPAIRRQLRLRRHLRHGGEDSCS